MTLVIDGHNDLPMQLRGRFGYRVEGLDESRPGVHTSIPRLRAGKVGGQFWSVYVPSDLSEPDAVVATMEQIDAVYRMAAAYPEDFAIAYGADDVERIMGAGRIASLIGIEGGHSIATSLGVLRAFARLGVRYMTLTHNHHTSWADSAAVAPAHGGLTGEGRAVVREMQRIGMLVDLSHVAPVTMHAALDTAFAPVIFSHSGARALNDHPRNVPDGVLTRLRDNGGVIQLTFVAPFVSAEYKEWFVAAHAQFPDPGSWPRAPRPGEDPASVRNWPDDAPRAAPELQAWLSANPRPVVTIAQVADHVSHARDVAGVDHVGLGGDYDGTTDLPEGLEDVSGYRGCCPRWPIAGGRRPTSTSWPGGTSYGCCGKRNGWPRSRCGRCRRRADGLLEGRSGYAPGMPIGAQPPGRRGTVEEPYSPLNLRLVLAVFGFVVCTVLSIWLFRSGWTLPGWLLAAWAAVAVIDIVVVQLRRRARRRAEGNGHHSLFE